MMLYAMLALVLEKPRIVEQARIAHSKLLLNFDKVYAGGKNEETHQIFCLSVKK